MEFVDKLKPFGLGVVSGAVAWWIVLAFAFGWTSAGTAEQMAARQSDEAVIAALAPVCAERFLAQPDAAAQKVALSKASSWQRRDHFQDEWVTLPGDSYPDPELIGACTKIVLETPAAKASSKEADAAATDKG
ncbi:MAG: hypothetical protein ACM3JG_17175 [Thiohalocapsa sp.]